MLGNLLVHLTSVQIGGLEAFWEIPAIPPIVLSIDLIVLSPPLWVDHGI